MDLLIATTNLGKIREIRLALHGTSVSVRTLGESGFGHIQAPDETETTFEGNARLKARYYCRRTGLVTLGEDSGLEIDALAGRPGVESARYPGDTYREKFDNLHQELAGLARPWTARYVCALALVAAPDEAAQSWRATVEGEIAAAPCGTHGFGYDPIFFYPPYGTTLGDVSDAQKLAVSHRGRAIALFAAWVAAQQAPGPR